MSANESNRDSCPEPTEFAPKGGFFDRIQVRLAVFQFGIIDV
jgi:hypothetical protein